MFVGVVLYFVTTSIKYIASLKFNVKIWANENLLFFIWSLIVSGLAALVVLLEPEAVDSVFGSLGITIARLESGELSGVLLGVFIAIASKSAIKPIKPIKKEDYDEF